ncbi:MAG: calcineurin-like phosphoesterase C-terminal domain-containing protein [Hyphomicrobiaceae bacterium]
MVSNGRDVVLTSHDGSWSLPVRSGDHVFVVKPSNWSAPACDGCPSFFYLHQPNGTPAEVQLRFGGVAPTGLLPLSIDFPLRRRVEDSRFDVLLLADMQPGNAMELDFVRDETLNSLLGTNAAFAINHGDVMGDDLSLLPRYRRMLKATGITWHHCPGNHDMNLDTTDERFAFETWKRELGPTHYAFQHGRATFIILNNVEYLPSGSRQPDGRAYRGRIGERQLAFVENILRHVAHDDLVVLSTHIPLVNFEDPESEQDNTTDRKKLLELLGNHPRNVSLAGHSHTTEHHYLGRDHGYPGNELHHHHILTAACGSWWSGAPDHRGIPQSDSRDGTPKGFHVLSVDGNSYSTRFVPSGAVDHEQMRIAITSAAPDGPPASSFPDEMIPVLKTRYVLVDVFDGGPRTNVFCEITGSSAEPFELRQVAAPDPYIVDMFQRHAEKCKPWVKPAVSSHMWTGPLPEILPAGAHRLTIWASDQYGHTARHSVVFEIGT